MGSSPISSTFKNQVAIPQTGVSHRLAHRSYCEFCSAMVVLLNTSGSLITFLSHCWAGQIGHGIGAAVRESLHLGSQTVWRRCSVSAQIRRQSHRAMVARAQKAVRAVNLEKVRCSLILRLTLMQMMSRAPLLQPLQSELTFVCVCMRPYTSC